MVIFGKPTSKNSNSYICLNSNDALILQELGYFPCYRWFGDIYFTKTDKILEEVKHWNLRRK